MTTALRELIAFFGVEVDDKKLDAAGEKMEGLAGLAERVGATIGLAFGLHEIGEFVRGQIEVGAQLFHTSEMLGLTVGDLQAFQYAAANAGLGAEEADTALRFLNKNLGEAGTKGGDAAAAFQKLGVHIKDAHGKIRPTRDVLENVADGIRKLPTAAEKTAKAMEIFGRAGARMIPLLNKGSKGIEEFYAEFEKLGGGIDEEFVESAEEAEHQINKMNLAFKGVKATIANALLPAFTWVVAKFTEAVSWFREFSKHSYIVSTALGTLAAISGVLVAIWGIMNIEVLLALFALALLVLIVDDVYTAFMGGKSVIGDFIDSLFGIGATQVVVQALKEVAGELGHELLETWGAVKRLWAAFGGLSDQAGPTTSGLGLLKGVIEGVGFATKSVIAGINALINALSFLIEKYGELKKAHPVLAGILGKVVNPVGAAAGDAGQLGGFAKFLAGGSAPEATTAMTADTAYVSGAAGGPVHHGDVNRQTEINVNVTSNGSSPEAVGKAAASGTKRAHEEADMQSSFAAVPGGGGF